MIRKVICCISAVLTVFILSNEFELKVYAVQTYSDDIKLSIEVTACSKDKSDGKIKVTISNYQKCNAYAISFDSGKVFYKIKGRSLTLTGAKNDFYNICAMKNSDWNTVTERYTVYVGCECARKPLSLQIQSFGENIYTDGSVLVSIRDYNPENKYVLFLNGGTNTYTMSGRALKIISLNDSEYTVQVKELSAGKPRYSPMYRVKIDAPKIGRHKYIKADALLQNPELPTGCEITSLTMLLNYLGFEAEKCNLADNYLEKGNYRQADPYDVFVGNPRNVHAYGCYSVPIVKAAEKYLNDLGTGDRYMVRNMTGCNFTNLCAALDNGCPVIVWGTMGMKNTSKGASWIIPGTKEKYTWIGGEHCLLMTGYDIKRGIVYMNDPLKGAVAYDLELFKKRFIQIGCHAVIIKEKS